MEKVKSPLSIGVEISGYRFHHSTTLDWLQVDFRGYSEKSQYLDIKDTYKKTSVFNKVYEIREKKVYIASMVNEPIEDFLPANMNLIKLINRELYYGKPISNLLSIGLDLKLTNHAASRIDFAIDFNTFLYGYKPITFIKDFINGKILKRGLRRGNIAFDYSKEEMLHEIKFMKKDSNMSVKLYNKTKEMREVKNKPYIIESWINNDLDITKDVWRLEFSIHLPKFSITDKDTGEISKFDYTKLDSKVYMNTVINALISKYFDFRYNTNIKDISDMPRVKLFPFPTSYSVAFERNEAKSSTAKDVKFLSMLQSVNNEVREIRPYLSHNIDELVSYYENTRQLNIKIEPKSLPCKSLISVQHKLSI